MHYYIAFKQDYPKWKCVNLQQRFQLIVTWLAARTPYCPPDDVARALGIILQFNNKLSALNTNM